MASPSYVDWESERLREYIDAASSERCGLSEVGFNGAEPLRNDLLTRGPSAVIFVEQIKRASSKKKNTCY